MLVGRAKAWSFTEQDTDPQLVIPVGGTVEVNGPDRRITRHLLTAAAIGELFVAH